MKDLSQQATRFYSIIYPGYFQLPKSKFLDFTFENQNVKFLLGNLLKPLVIFDAFNEFVSGNTTYLKKIKSYEVSKVKDGVIFSKNGEPEDPLSFQVIMERLPEMRIFYNLRCCHLFFIVDQASDNPDFEFAKRLIDYFITIYKRSLNDVFISDFSQLSEPYLVIESGNFFWSQNGYHEFKTDSIQALWKRFVDKQRSLKDNLEKGFETVKANLSLGDRLDHKDIFMKAQEEIYLKGNYKYALLEAFIYIEQLIISTLNEIKLKKGVSGKTLKTFDREVGIGYLLNIEIPLVFKDYSKNKELFNRIDKIRKKRNKVVHEGEQVTEEEAKFAVSNAFDLYLIFKNYQIN